MSGLGLDSRPASPSAAAAPGPNGAAPARARSSRARAVAAATVLAAGGVTAWLLLGGDSGQPAASPTSAGTSTAAVRRTDLLERESFTGALGYGSVRTVTNQLRGTITGLPAEGSRIERGGMLYEVDDRPVPFFTGTTPAWRPMKEGDEGVDITQLEANLASLGYDPGAVDGTFSSATTAAVERWQDDSGRAQDGRVELGEVVFLSGTERRAGKLSAKVGDPLSPGRPILETTATSRLVTFSLGADRQGLAARGQRVDVELPDGNVVRGTITGVGKVASGGEEPALEVTVALRGAAAARGLDQAPVSVDVVSERRRGVLAVPVVALLAVEDGGYAVDVRDRSGETRSVRVTPGLFADGLVEISGRGLREGQRVVVPAQ